MVGGAEHKSGQGGEERFAHQQRYQAADVQGYPGLECQLGEQTGHCPCGQNNIHTFEFIASYLSS